MAGSGLGPLGPRPGMAGAGGWCARELAGGGADGRGRHRVLVQRPARAVDGERPRRDVALDTGIQEVGAGGLRASRRPFHRCAR